MSGAVRRYYRQFENRRTDIPNSQNSESDKVGSVHAVSVTCGVIYFFQKWIERCSKIADHWPTPIDWSIQLPTWRCISVRNLSSEGIHDQFAATQRHSNGDFKMSCKRSSLITLSSLGGSHARSIASHQKSGSMRVSIHDHTTTKRNFCFTNYAVGIHQTTNFDSVPALLIQSARHKHRGRDKANTRDISTIKKVRIRQFSRTS